MIKIITVSPGVVRMTMDPRIAGLLSYLVDRDLRVISVGDLDVAGASEAREFLQEYKRWETSDGSAPNS